MYWYCKEKPDVDQFIFRAKPAIPPHHWREKAVEIQAKDQVVVEVEAEVEEEEEAEVEVDQYHPRLKMKVDLREWVLNRTIARWRYLTTTTRIHFGFSLLFKFVNPTED